MVDVMRWSRMCGGMAALTMTALTALSGPAAAGAGQPSPGQIGFQEPVTEVARRIGEVHDLVNYIIIAITVFVLVLMAICIVRFNARANPVPSKFTHNATVEVLWTVVPILILLFIAVPSFRLLYLQYTYPTPDITIKAIGNAWYWEHEYPDHGGLKITSNMVRDEDVLKADMGAAAYNAKYGKLEDGLAKLRILQQDSAPAWAKRGEPRQLAVDNAIAVPVGKVVHMLVTSNDVIHSWTIPSFGSKVQAVPGRITHTWFRPEKTGAYYGQCSVVCGKDHASMPIGIRVVDQKSFDEWIAAVKARDLNKARQILKAATETPTGPKLAQAAEN